MTEPRESKRAITGWEKANKSLVNYQIYLTGKPNRFDLTIIDLLYISNFKGGNSSIHEEAKFVEAKLKKYSALLIEIDTSFKEKYLGQITDFELEKLVVYIKHILALCLSRETSIDGFKSSFLSALLHSYFPNLIPILDRRLLINMDLIDQTNLQKSNQVKNIENFYEPLVKKVREISKEKNLSLREIDREYFIMALPVWVMTTPLSESDL